MWLLIAAGALLAVLQSPAQAFFFDRHFDERWCLGNSVAFGGSMDCAYRTFEQCQEMQSGIGGLCVENPRWFMAERKRGERLNRYPR